MIHSIRTSTNSSSSSSSSSSVVVSSRWNHWNVRMIIFILIDRMVSGGRRHLEVVVGIPLPKTTTTRTRSKERTTKYSSDSQMIENDKIWWCLFLSGGTTTTSSMYVCMSVCGTASIVVIYIYIYIYIYYVRYMSVIVGSLHTSPLPHTLPKKPKTRFLREQPFCHFRISFIFYETRRNKSGIIHDSHTQVPRSCGAYR